MPINNKEMYFLKTILGRILETLIFFVVSIVGIPFIMLFVISKITLVNLEKFNNSILLYLKEKKL